MEKMSNFKLDPKTYPSNDKGILFSLKSLLVSLPIAANSLQRQAPGTQVAIPNEPSVPWFQNSQGISPENDENNGTPSFQVASHQYTGRNASEFHFNMPTASSKSIESKQWTTGGHSLKKIPLDIEEISGKSEEEDVLHSVCLRRLISEGLFSLELNRN